MGVVRRTGLLVHQHPGENNFPRLAACLYGLFRQYFSLVVVRLLGIADFELGQQRQRVAIAVVCGFLRPVYGLGKIAEADVSIRQLILCTWIAGFGLLSILDTWFHGA